MATLCCLGQGRAGGQFAPAAIYLLLTGVTPVFYGVLALYLAYSVIVAVRGKSFSGMLGLLALFGDTVFFLIMASYGADRCSGWPAPSTSSCWAKPWRFTARWKWWWWWRPAPCSAPRCPTAPWRWSGR